ncbi:MAG: hypothetical protein JSV36_04605 [Anaerolineae bacterium]|nr:MAG: hypothetical protein JSV36_04605 [Anaerolineae bacterium]
MELRTLVFKKAGKQNTDAALEIAKERALALRVKQVVVASSHGYTARKAQALFAPEGIKVIAVSICHSWESEGWIMSAETKAELEEMGVVVHTGIHALGDGVGSAFTEKYGGRAPEEVVRDTLYCFCQGMKVAVECLLMAADAGLLDMGQEVIAIAGTDSGADTAIVCQPAYPRTFHQLEIREVLAKPRVP